MNKMTTADRETRRRGDAEMGRAWVRGIFSGTWPRSTASKMGAFPSSTWERGQTWGRGDAEIGRATVAGARQRLVVRAVLRRFGMALCCLSTFALAATTNAQAPASPSTNLIPNGNFSAADPLQGWRVDFPYEGWYVKNKGYVSATSENAQNGGKCVLINLPPGVAGNEGGKIESAFIKAEPGATYRVEIDCMTWDFSAMLHAEAWTHDPKPIPQPDKFRVPPAADHPALVMCYRAQIPEPHGRSKTWQTVSRQFKVPKTIRVAGEDQVPEYLSLKAYTYAATPNGGKSYFGNFRLYKIKNAE